MTSPARLMALRWRPFRLPLKHRFEAAHAAIADREGVVLELVGEDDVRGVGEASPMPSLGDGGVADVEWLLRAHSEALLEDSARAVDDLVLGPGVAALRCAIDAALLDLEGKRRGQPVAALLADRPASDVEVNAVIGGGGAEEAERFACEAVSVGYRVLKLKVGSAGLDRDVARVERVRRACPNAAIRLDANGAWTVEQADEALERLGPLDIELIEQPVHPSDVEALVRLRERGRVPIAADEAMADPQIAGRVLDHHASDLIVLKPMRMGVRASLEIAQRAAKRGIPAFVTTTFDSSIGTAAALHLAAALGIGRPADGLSTGEHLADDLVARPLLPREGRMPVPARPGLGVELDAAALERLATGPWTEVRPRR
jgi:o-succinylbenzoate synthase